MTRHEMGDMTGATEKERLEVDKISTTPVSEKVSRTSVQLPDELWELLETATKALSEQAKRDGRRPFTRDDVIAHACRWWLQAWRGDQSAKKTKD